MIDSIGQPISVGDTVIHCGGNCADTTQYKVIRTTAKMAFVGGFKSWRSNKETGLLARTLVNVTANLQLMDGSKILVDTEDLAQALVSRRDAGFSPEQDAQAVRLCDSCGTIIPINLIEGYRDLLNEEIGPDTSDCDF